MNVLLVCREVRHGVMGRQRGGGGRRGVVGPYGGVVGQEQRLMVLGELVGGIPTVVVTIVPVFLFAHSRLHRR
jgi:hypothetical protein